MTPATAIRPALGLLLSALMLSAAAQPTADEHSAHHPDAPQATETPTTEAMPQSMMQSMRERMAKMREAQDPAIRMQLMEEQMAAMESMMQAMPAGCPMMGGMGGEGGMPMAGMGGMGGKGGMAMPGMEGMGMHGMGMMRRHAEMMHKRVEALEKRVDLMQMMMQMQMGRPGAMGDMPSR